MKGRLNPPRSSLRPAQEQAQVLIQAFYTGGTQFDHDHMLDLELHISLFQKQYHKNVNTFVG